jgi:hypothetical protein
MGPCSPQLCRSSVMGHSYKGTAKPFAPNLSTQAASCYALGGQNFAWVYAYPNPFRWSVERIVGGVWTRVITFVGTTHQTSGLFHTGEIVSVVGIDASLNNVTARSSPIVVLA